MEQLGLSLFEKHGLVRNMVGGSIISSCQWKDVDKRKHERGLCHHVGVHRNQVLLTSITCEGWSLRRDYLTVYSGKLKIICGVVCLRNVNTSVGDKFMLDVYV